MHKIIEGPAAWRGPELAASRDWIHEFSPAEIAEIETALRSAKARGKTLDTLTREDFPLPTGLKAHRLRARLPGERQGHLSVPRHQDRRLFEGRPAAAVLGTRPPYRHRGVAEQGRRHPRRRAQRRRRYPLAAGARLQVEPAAELPHRFRRRGRAVRALRRQDRRPEQGRKLGLRPQRDSAAAAGPARRALSAVHLELEPAGAARREALLSAADLQHAGWQVRLPLYPRPDQQCAALPRSAAPDAAADRGARSSRLHHQRRKFPHHLRVQAGRYAASQQPHLLPRTHRV